MSEAGIIGIVCIRCEGADPADIFQPAYRRPCSQCSAPVWVSPSSMNVLLVHPTTQFICEQCAPLQPGWGTGEVGVAPGAFGEMVLHAIRKAFGD